MRITPAVAAVPFLVLLLTWLSLHAINTDAERFDLALGEIDNFEMLEAALHRDVLVARAGVRRNYDPLARETDALDVTVGHLQQITALDAATRSAIDRLAMAVTRQEQFVEQIKNPRSKLRGIGGRKEADQKNAASCGEYVPKVIQERQRPVAKFARLFRAVQF